MLKLCSRFEKALQELDIGAFLLESPDIGVRAGGARGAAAPPKFWATQIFWAARENLGKASF